MLVSLKATQRQFRQLFLHQHLYRCDILLILMKGSSVAIGLTYSKLDVWTVHIFTRGALTRQIYIHIRVSYSARMRLWLFRLLPLLWRSHKFKAVTVPNFRMPVEDAPISQMPGNDTPGTKTFIYVHISKSRLKPPDPNANQTAPRRSARLA